MTDEVQDKTFTVDIERWPMDYRKADQFLASIAPMIVDFTIETEGAKDGKVRPPNFGTMITLWERGMLQIVVARNQGKVIGWRMAMTSFDPITSMNVAQMHGIFVLPEWREKSVGSAMHKKMMERVESMSAHRIIGTAMPGTRMSKILQDSGLRSTVTIYKKD